MQKYFLTLVLLPVALSACDMQNNKFFMNKKEIALAGVVGVLAYVCNQKKANEMLLKTIKKASENNFKKDEDWNDIENCLKQRAVDIDYKFGKEEMSPLMLAIKYKKENIITYLLEKKADINTRNWAGFGILETMLFEVSSTFEDKKIFKILLKKGLNPNEKLTSRNYFSALYWTISCRDDDFTKLLIKYGANVNLCYGDHTPLTWALFHKKIEIIQRLCQARASLVNVDLKCNTIFHRLVGNYSRNYIETIITYARFDSCNNGKDRVALRQTIFGALCILKLIPNRDLQFFILSKLPVKYLFASKGLYKQLLMRNYKNLFLPQVYKHIKSLEKILQYKNSKGETAFDRLEKKYENKDGEGDKLGMQQLFTGRLKEDIEILSQAKEHENVSENNLALKIYNNYAALLK